MTDPSPVAYYRVKKASLLPKEGYQPPTPTELREILRIDEEQIEGMSRFDEQSEELLHSITDQAVEHVDLAQSSVLAPAAARTLSFGRQENWFSFSVESEMQRDETIEDEVTRCFEHLCGRFLFILPSLENPAECRPRSESLQSKGLSLTQIQHQNFLLANMDDFPRANKAYSAFFGSSPPSRACVSVVLPPNQRVRLEAMGYDDSQLPERSGLGRSALHVQSISYWAPANIGPYSQAVMVSMLFGLFWQSLIRECIQVGHRLTIAGQIGLIPPTLSLPSPQSFSEEAVLSLQHVRRIMAVLRSSLTAGGGWEGWVEGVICWYTRSKDLPSARSLWRSHASTVSELLVNQDSLLILSPEEWIYPNAHRICTSAPVTERRFSRMAVRGPYWQESYTCTE